MEEDTDYMKLPIEDRCVHKLWKARLNGYEESAKLFRQIDDEKSPEFGKFIGMVKKFVVDSNAAAQEKGLEAVLAYVENYALAGKTVGEVMTGIVTKCIAAPKAKTKDMAVQITLMYIEIEKYEAVQEELFKGMEHKNPKIVSACIAATTMALREFGSKVINIKPLIKKMPVLLEDRDKTVRDEMKNLVIEMYRWVGAALKPQLNSLKPVQITELEAEFEKVKGGKVVPTRYLKSQQQRQAKLTSETAAIGDADDEEDDGDGAAGDVDPYDLMDPVDILSKMPKDIYERLEAKKWQERKEAVGILEQLLEAPKLENGDYGDLVRALKKIITKDTNVMVIAVAAKCLACLANGLKKRFQPYAAACIPSILEKFREKKQNVVVALKEAIDAIYLSTTIEAIQEDVLASLENKNPSVKAETASFLARCFTKCTPVMLNKKLLKAYTTALLKLLNDPDPTVRDHSAEALGTAMKAVGEKAIMPFLIDLEQIKMAKITECCEKAVIVAKVPRERPCTAPAKMARAESENKAGSVTAKPVKRPTTSSGTKKPAMKKPVASAPNVVTSKSKSNRQAEKELSSEEVDERASEIFSEEILSGLGDVNWKIRLSSVEQFLQVIGDMESSEMPTQVLVRTLNKKPGLKDTNFQVLKARLEALKKLAETVQMSSVCVEACIADVTDKLGDPKNGTLAADTLTALAEATELNLVATLVLDFAFSQKGPKVQMESLNWLSCAIKEFGFAVQAKAVLENAKKAILATHPGVRTAGIQLVGMLGMYMGQQLSMYFDGEKPAIKQLIQAEVEKHAGESPPMPTRGLSKISRDEEDDEEEESPPEEKTDVCELMTHVDISPLISDAIISELKDKNWKVSKEAVQKLEGILKENKCISSNLGELPQVLTQRMLDSNSNIAKTAITFCQSLGVAMGSQGKVHITTFFPALLQGMGDNKAWIRSAAIACINTWGEQCGFKEFFKCEMVAEALKSDSPTLRSELWAWLAEKLPDLPNKSIPKEELLICLPYLYSNLEDRSADVRKNAQEAILPFMIHLNYTTMAKAAEKLKALSRASVLQSLEKVRGNLPTKPAPPSKRGSPCDESEPAKAIKGGAKAAGAGKGAAKGKGNAGKAGNRKKDDEVDTSPLLQNNNLKNQRSIDEQKLRVLKWNFTSPREEFFDLLRDQMTIANVNKTLMANMFHSDFKYHLKAIDALSEDLPSNGSATVANLDLILKWMTLRFFDTNPSVLLKGLEYLQTVFAMLIKEDYNMFDNEASSFIPYLILKIGDPKDAVRNSVRALFKQMESIYPVTKLFTYVMEGLKSKNARQRTECLDLLGSLIEMYGVVICHPSPAAALKEIARQISDRDNSVRNAALNCVVQAYFLEGEKVYKMVGQISDKDLSLLEERIKRAAKNRPPPGSRPSIPAKQQQTQGPQPPRMVRQGSEVTLHKDSDLEESFSAPVLRNNAPKQRPVSGPFGLDTKLLEQLEGESLDLCAPKLREFDLKEILETPMPATGFSPSSGSLNESYHSLSSSSIPLAQQAQQPKQLSNCTTTEQVLDWGISNIASPEFETAWQACVQVEALLSSDKVNRMQGKEDSLLMACIMQLRLLRNSATHGTPIHSLEKGYRTLLMLILEFFEHLNLSQNLSKDVLIDLIEQMLMLLVEQRLDDLDSGNSYVRIINILMVRIIERSNHTSITCAFLKHLHNCSANNNVMPQRFEELAMKCLWKVIKLMPTWENDLDIVLILRELHIFLRDYPSSLWKRRQSDTPVRTVKTILHTLLKMVGSEKILHYLGQVENLNESELKPYLIKLLKRVKPEDLKSPPKKEGKPHRLSKVTHEQLSEIFKKIGSKDQTKQGLELLYDFREQHPEADIEPFLRKSSQFFQDYIERGLQSIQAERKNAGEHGLIKSVSSTTSMSSLGLQESGGAVTPFSDIGDMPHLPSTTYTEHTFVRPRIGTAGAEELDTNPDSKNAVYYLERLRELQARAGIRSATANVINPGSQQQHHPPVTRDDNIENDENLNLHRSREEDEVKTEVSHTCSSTGMGIDDLRKRLEAFKSNKR